MSPSSPPPGEEVRGRGRAECHASAGGKTGICYGFSRKWPGGKIFHPCKRNRNKLMWQLGRSPAGETPQFFSPLANVVTISGFFLGGRFPIFFAFSGSSPFSQNRGENRFERDAPAFSRGRLTCGGLHFFFFFRHFMCTLPSKFILHICRISRCLKGIVRHWFDT